MTGVQTCALPILKRSLVFPILLFSAISLHWSLRKAFLSLLAILWNTAFRCLYEGDQPWDFFGRNHAKVETPLLWPPHAKIWLIGKDSDAGRDWGQEEKGTTEDEMAGWHHWLDGCELSELRELVMDKEAWHAVIHGGRRVGHDWATELNWM